MQNINLNCTVFCLYARPIMIHFLTCKPSLPWRQNLLVGIWTALWCHPPPSSDLSLSVSLSVSLSLSLSISANPSLKIFTLLNLHFQTDGWAAWMREWVLLSFRFFVHFGYNLHSWKNNPVKNHPYCSSITCKHNKMSSWLNIKILIEAGVKTPAVCVNIDCSRQVMPW